MAIAAMEGFTFGADPELFIKDNKGRFVSAEGLIPGTKEEPYKVDCGAIQVDGMAAEFNIDPASNFQTFRKNIKTVLAQLTAMLPNGYTLHATPSVSFDPEVFDATPDKAKELGCSPDFNAWTGGINPPPKYLADPRLRCAGGHLHIGWTEGAELTDMEHIQNCNDLVKQLDWYLGGWSLNMDKDVMRRRLYGKAGACRYKSYGVEYRVLSNFWVLTESRIEAVWNRMQLAINDMATLYIPEKAPADFSTMLIKAISSGELYPSLRSIGRYPLTTVNPDLCRF